MKLARNDVTTDIRAGRFCTSSIKQCCKITMLRIRAPRIGTVGRSTGSHWLRLLRIQFLAILGAGLLAATPVWGGNGKGGITLSASTTRIVASEANRDLAEALAAEVYDRTGIDLPVLSDDLVDGSAWETLDLILLGNLNDNRATKRLYFDFKAFLDAAFPGEKGFMVKTLIDPFSRGRNVILVGGSERQGTWAAVENFKDKVRTYGREMPQLHKFVSQFPPRPAPSEAEILAILEENRRNFEVGLGTNSLRNVSLYGLNFHFSADPVWARLFRETLLDFVELVRIQGGNWDFDPMNATYFRLAVLLPVWDLIEKDEAFSDADRKALSEAFADMAHYVASLSYAQPLANLPGEPRQNHSTFVGLSLEAAIRYFSRRGEEDVERWKTIAERIFDGQVQTYRSDDDAAGYTSMSPLHAFDYYQRQGSDRARRAGFLDRLADLAILITDNRREEVTFGDVRRYFPWDREVDIMGSSATELTWQWASTTLSRSVWLFGDPGHQWAFNWLTEGKRIPFASPYSQHYLGMQLYAIIDSPAEVPERLLGVSRVLLDEPPLRWVASRAEKPEWAPRQGVNYLDKLTLRSSFDPADEYLLLDGIAAFTHGHKDANAILRLTWQDRIWLADLDYTHQMPRYHNSIDVARDGRTGVLPPLAVLDIEADLGDTALVRSRLEDYNGVDWARNIIWRKRGYFVVLDELKARQEGDYDLRCYWRNLGTVDLDGRTLEVRQPGAYFRIVNADSSAFSLTEIDPSIEKSNQLGDWSRYPYSDNIVRVLEQQQNSALSPGETAYFLNLLYARPEDRDSDLTMRALGPGHALVEGQGEAAVVGAAPRGLRLAALDLDAQLFRLGLDSLEASGLKSVRSPIGFLSVDRPVSLAVSGPGRGRLVVQEPTRVTVGGAWRLGPGPTPGEDGLHASLLKPGDHEIFLDRPLWDRTDFENLTALSVSTPPDPDPAPLNFGMHRVWTAEAGDDVTVLEAARQVGEWLLGFRDGRVLGLDESGSLHELTRMTDAVSAMLPLPGGGLAVGDRDGQVVLLNADGSSRWERKFDAYWGYRERVIALALQPFGNDQRLIIANEAPRLHAFDLEGRWLWSTPAPGTKDHSSEGRAFEWWGALTRLKTTDLTGDGRHEIVVGTEYKTPVVVFDPEGFLKWIVWGWEGGESRSTTPFWGINARDLEVAALEPGGQPSIIYAADTDDLYVLSPKPNLRWSVNIGGEANELAVYDLTGDGVQEVIVTTGSGYLNVYNHQCERLWWRRHLGGLAALAVGHATVEAEPSPVIAVGSTEGRVFVYSPMGDLLSSSETEGSVVHLRLLDRGWGELLCATDLGEIVYWSLGPERPFSRSSRHHY